MPDSFITIPNYNLFRKDTPSTVHKHGVCIYVHNALVSVHLDIPVNNLVGVYLPDYNIHILAVYRPPSSLPLDDAIFLSYLNDFAPGKELIILGDFNLPSIQWAGETPIVSSAHDQSFLDCFTSLGLLQWITEPTNIRSDNTLDLVFTSDYDRIVDIQLCAPLPNCDHLPIIFSYLFEVNVPTTNSRKDFLWHKGNYTGLNHALLEVDFDYEFSDKSVNEAYDRFVEIIHHMVSLYVPIRNSLPNSTSLLPFKARDWRLALQTAQCLDLLQVLALLSWKELPSNQRGTVYFPKPKSPI